MFTQKEKTSSTSSKAVLAGTISVVISSVAYGIQPTMSSVIISMGVAEPVLYMYFAGFSAVTFALVLLLTHGSFRISGRMFLQIAVMALLGNTLMELFFAYSFKYIPVAMTELFHFSYPALVILIMVLFFRQKLTVIKVAAVALAFTGIMLITDMSSSLSFAGCLFGVASGLVYGIYIIANDRSEAAKLPAPQLLFWICLCSACYLLLINLVSDTRILFPSVKSALLTAACSQWGSVLPIFTMAYGVRRLGASRTVLLNNLEPMVGVIFSTLIFHTAVTLRLILACICILGCSLLSSFVHDTE